MLKRLSSRIKLRGVIRVNVGVKISVFLKYLKNSKIYRFEILCTNRYTQGASLSHGNA